MIHYGSNNSKFVYVEYLAVALKIQHVEGIVAHRYALFLCSQDVEIVIITNSQRSVPRSDMEFVKNFTPPDFQAKNFTPSILPNFNSFSKKKHKK